MKYVYLSFFFSIFCFQISCSHVNVEMASGKKNTTTSFTHYSHYLLYGLIGLDTLDASKLCHNQNLVRFENYFTMEDVLFMLTTLGLYTPKSTKVWCEMPDNPKDSEEITL